MDNGYGHCKMKKQHAISQHVIEIISLVSFLANIVITVVVVHSTPSFEGHSAGKDTVLERDVSCRAIDGVMLSACPDSPSYIPWHIFCAHLKHPCHACIHRASPMANKQCPLPVAEQGDYTITISELVNKTSSMLLHKCDGRFRALCMDISTSI